MIFIGISINLIMDNKNWNTYCHTLGTANNRTELRENEQWLKFISDLFIVTFSNTFPLHQAVASARTNCPTELSLSLLKIYIFILSGVRRDSDNRFIGEVFGTKKMSLGVGLGNFAFPSASASKQRTCPVRWCIDK